MKTTTYKCPECEYRRPRFSSVAMHYMRCHHESDTMKWFAKLDRELMQKIKLFDAQLARLDKTKP